MMQEYDDDFFFEEDKMKEESVSNLLVPLDEKPTAKEVERDEKEVENQDCLFNDLRVERYILRREDLLGMTVTSGSVMLNKDEKNLIGISIGGGAPLCPCLYIVQFCPSKGCLEEIALSDKTAHCIYHQ